MTFFEGRSGGDCKMQVLQREEAERARESGNGLHNVD